MSFEKKSPSTSKPVSKVLYVLTWIIVTPVIFLDNNNWLVSRNSLLQSSGLCPETLYSLRQKFLHRTMNILLYFKV